LTKALSKDRIDATMRIFDLEDVMLGMPQLELETIHHFAPGIYARELRIPADTALTGATHKTEHLNICAIGRLTVVNGIEEKEVVGPCIFVSQPGTKRAAYVHEDAVWITIHATEETDVEKLETMLVTNDREEVRKMLGHITMKELT